MKTHLKNIILVHNNHKNLFSQRVTQILHEKKSGNYERKVPSSFHWLPGGEKTHEKNGKANENLK